MKPRADMARELIIFAVALLMVTAATADRRMLQSPGNYNEFPFYGACNTKPADNAITLSGDIREETLPNGNIRACFGISVNPDCPPSIDGKTNVCCVGYGGYPANMYKFEVLTKETCRNSIIYGAGAEGPKITGANGVSRQLQLNWQATPVGGFTYQKARFSGLDLFANNTYTDGAEVCFVMNKAFTDANCLGLNNLCKNGGLCTSDVTMIESDKLPRPESKHACCPLLPKFCPELFGECPANYKPRPGFETIQGSTLEQCCQPKTCADHNVACSPYPFVVRKPDYSTVIGNTEAQCCNYFYCPNFPAAACFAPNYIQRPGFDTYRGQTVAECCVPQFCPQRLPGGVCPAGYKPKAGFNTIFGGSVAECCEPKTCLDNGVVCQAPNFINKPNFATIVGSTVVECCTPQFCPQRLPSGCPALWKPKPGYEAIFGGSVEECCTQKTCSDNVVTCAPAPFVVNKPNFVNIIGSTQQQCCDFKYCPDFPAAACIAPNYIQRPGFDTYRGQTVAECCVPQFCPQRLGPIATACGDRHKPRANFNTIFGGSIDECCLPKTCADFNVVCAPAPFWTNQPNFNSITSDLVSDCCVHKTCKDLVVCPATTKPKPGFEGIEGDSVEECCDPKMCPERMPGGACPADYKPKPGWEMIVGGTTAECCNPMTCADHSVVCSPYPFVVQKPDYNTIVGKTETACCNKLYCPDFPAATCVAPNYLPKPNAASIQGNTVAQCCDPQRCPQRLGADPVAACGSRHTPRPDYANIFGGSIEECCVPKTCPQLLPGGTCGDYGAPRPGFDTIVPREDEDLYAECCVGKLDQKYPFPYCRCHGAYNLTSASQAEAASGDAVSEDNLRFRMASEVVSQVVTEQYTEYCFQLEYYGIIPITVAKPTVPQWCAAQKTVNRVEFLSKPECTKRDFTAVYYQEGSATAIPLGVEDQYPMAADGVTPVYNDVVDPSNGAPFQIARASMKAVKIQAYLEKYGISLEDLAEPAPGGKTPAGKVCMRLKSGSACAVLRDFCGSRYFYYKDNAPVESMDAVRCQWSIMEGINQKCCPTQTTLQVL